MNDRTASKAKQSKERPRGGCVSDVLYTENRDESGQLTSSDAGYASREVADDDIGLFFADEGKVDIVVCEVDCELFYTACAGRK